jgi:linoleate 10R-lipoxygenase
MNVILGDYLAAILGTFREGSSWCLNPLEEIRCAGKTNVSRADGNAVSVEFNLLYRVRVRGDSRAAYSPVHPDLVARRPLAHRRTLARIRPQGEPPAPPRRAARPGVRVDQAGLPDRELVCERAARARSAQVDIWRVRLSFFPFFLFFPFLFLTPSPDRLHRQPNGAFKSNEIARLLHDATRTVACGFGPRGIPAVLKPVEVMGIEQARRWGVCTLNEFRQFLGLRKFKSFEEWCPVGDVAVRLFFPPSSSSFSSLRLSTRPTLICFLCRKPPGGSMDTSIISSFTSACRPSKPSRPALARACALASPSPAPSSPMPSASRGAIGS